MEGALRSLEERLADVFDRAVRALGSAPRHEVRFSPRITTSWAIIYFRRRLVRLSPYLFLLEEEVLPRGSYWRELEATVKHEAVHAHLFARSCERGHTDEFHALLAGLGVTPNGASDLGPLNATHRFVYRCTSCRREWRRRRALAGQWSCGRCSPGKFDPRHPLALADVLASPWERLRGRSEAVRRAIAESLGTIKPGAPGATAPASRRRSVGAHGSGRLAARRLRAGASRGAPSAP